MLCAIGLVMQYVCAGCSLTGAGGGGFLAAIIKNPEERQKVEDIIKTSPVRP